MKFWLSNEIAPLEEMVQFARDVESMGFEGLCIPEHLVVPLRNVFTVTKLIGTLAVLSNNRFVLGTGTGWLPEEFDTVGEDWSTRGRRLDEMLDVMRDFLDDGYAEYHGKFFDFP